VPFSVASPLWSDGAVKERYVALPDGAALTVGADGDLSLPDGGVLAKWFHVDGELVEVRLIGRAGDSYATASWRWDAALGDGVLAPDGAVVEVGDLSWEIPSRYACSSCHTSAAGTSLGLELAQIQEDLAYPSGVTASQVATLEHIGFLTSTVDVEPLVDPHGDADLDARARSYLHTNCSGCHRPGGGTPFPMDLRATTAPGRHPGVRRRAGPVVRDRGRAPDRAGARPTDRRCTTAWSPLTCACRTSAPRSSIRTAPPWSPPGSTASSTAARRPARADGRARRRVGRLGGPAVGPHRESTWWCRSPRRTCSNLLLDADAWPEWFPTMRSSRYRSPGPVTPGRPPRRADLGPRRGGALRRRPAAGATSGSWSRR
jgi:hypothetical protein